jgi:hypothetical protein
MFWWGAGRSALPQTADVNMFVPNPYQWCDAKGCNHDLAQGVLTAELLGYDGPHQMDWLGLIIVRAPLRPASTIP